MKTQIINRKNKSIFRKFSKEENSVWKILCHKNFKNLEGLASPFHKKGWKLLGMSMEEIPDFTLINKRLKKLTGWQVASTNVQYEKDYEWLPSLAQKVIKVTGYIRSKENINYTPLPDVFHDSFGHLPFLANKDYARIAHKFGLAYIKAKTKDEKKKIAENWWYGIEFSFIKENGKLKALGAGLVSSTGELKNALSKKVAKSPFNGEVIGKLDRSAHEFHKKLFVLESLEQLEDTVDRWL